MTNWNIWKGGAKNNGELEHLEGLLWIQRILCKL